MRENVKIITPLQEHKFLDSWYDLSDRSHFWFEWRFRAFLSELSDLKIPLDADWNVLDLGCGTGVLQNQIESETNWIVDSTDLDFEALSRAKPGRGQIMYYDIFEKRPEFKEKYDAIMLFDVLEHIENTEPFIESILFHLKKEGYLFVNVPALQTLYSRYDEIAGHFRRYNTKTLTAEFNKFPIHSRDVRYWGLMNVPILFLRKHALHLFGKNKSDDEIISQGFKPPNEFINSMFLLLMKFEMALMKKPFGGSSVLWVGEKSES